MNNRTFTTQSNDAETVVKPKGRRYNIIPTRVTEAMEIQLQRCVNSWIVKNTGDVRAYVNQWPIQPPPGAGLSGESFGPLADEGDIYTGRISITFDAGGTNPEVWVAQIVYMDPL
jgi:hypothetical protein